MIKIATLELYRFFLVSVFQIELTLPLYMGVYLWYQIKSEVHQRKKEVSFFM